MRYYTLSNSPEKPVSHDTSLVKRLLVDKGILPGIKGISQIVLPSGSSVETHSHENGYEVFYLIRGKATAIVGEENMDIEAGTCLIVEPREAHGFSKIKEDTEMIYFFLESVA